MVKNCKECKMMKNCPAIPSFIGMIKEFAKEEKVELSALSPDERSSYINTMIDEWLTYVDGHTTPGLVAYAREVLVA